jgi:hypothetical protein
MRKFIILFLLLFISLSYAQTKPRIQALIFEGVTDDTIGTITTADSVYIQFYDSSSEWKLLTSVISDGDTAMVTADDKVGENTLHFMLARESFWTQSPQMRFEFRNTGQDTCTSKWLNTAMYDGAFTLIVRADTVSSRVDYGNTILSGN